MAITYNLITSSTVASGGTAQVDFNSIPQTYTDLLIKTSTNVNTFNVLRIRFNGVSSSDYTQKILRGSGVGANSYSNAGWDLLTAFSPSYNSGVANTFTNNEYYITDYTNSFSKSILGDSAQEDNGTVAYSVLYAGLLNTSSAITSISIFPQSDNFNQYSTFYLYGIKNS